MRGSVRHRRLDGQTGELERARMNPTDAATNNPLSPTLRSRVTALIDEGNALEEQGRIAEAMAR